MDKPRANPKKKRGPLYIAAGIVGLAGLTLGLSQLKPALPSVDRAAIWPDSVKRGPMVRSVRGPGTLTPEDIRIIPAVTAGRVEQIYARPGTAVEAGTMLLTLSNPDVELQLLESERQYTAAQSELVNLRSTLQTQMLNQEGAIAQVQSAYNEAARQAKTNEELAARKLIAPNEVSRAKDTMAELEKRLEIEKKGLELLRETVDVRIESQALQVERLRGIVAFRNQQLASMDVRAGSEGVLQQLNLEVGQWVNPGIELARVVQPGRLKAVLRIPETQMRDVVIGQTALIDTRNDTIKGRVVRIDPAALNGTIGVDVAFDGELPPSARPDMSVDGTVEIDRLSDVLFIGRPNFGSAGATIGLFKVSKDGKTAERVQVRLGQTSVNHVEIVSGLQQGDVVILSDMSQWDAHQRVRISN
jgi:multidrug resistance efflux pump